MPRPRIRRALLSLASLALSACGPAAAPPPQAPPEPAPLPPARNLLLITFDTLRADHLGAWGYERATSPHIDWLAEEGVLFERAWSTAPWTLPSLASLMTSLHPTTHGAQLYQSALDERAVTLAEHLGAAGFATAGVASHVFLRESYGLHQGIDEYDTSLTLFGHPHKVTTATRVTRKALAWLEGRRGLPQRWMLWLHYFDPHDEYLLHEGVSEQFGVERDVDRYDGEVRHADAAMGKVLAKLAAMGWSDETVVVVTADHGEEFGDHGGRFHGMTLYREQLHVPLVIRAPGVTPRRVAGDVSLVDVMPTVLELLGLQPPPDIAGRSLVAAMRGAALPARPVLSELYTIQGEPMRAVRRGDMVVVRNVNNRTSFLLDTSADPGEHRNLVGDPKAAGLLATGNREIDAVVEEVTARAARLDTRPRDLELSDEVTRQLEELGYGVEGGGRSGPGAAGTAP